MFSDLSGQGVLDRFGQIEPVVFIAPDSYWYNGKAVSVADKVRAEKLATVRKVLIVDYSANPEALELFRQPLSTGSFERAW